MISTLKTNNRGYQKLIRESIADKFWHKYHSQQ